VAHQDLTSDDDDGPRKRVNLKRHDAESPSVFMVHLGDIQAQSTDCPESVYTTTAEILLGLDVPTVVLPGDNEWNDCGDPAQAWGYWKDTFGTFWTAWPERPGFEVQDAWPLNVAWREGGLLVLALTVSGGAVHDQGEWDEMLAYAATWVRVQLAEHSDATSLVVLMHAHPADEHQAFMTPVLEDLDAFEGPVLVIHADGHTWLDDQPWPAAPEVRRVQVEPGADAPPLQVTSTTSGFEIQRAPF
jgi:hypothetical protein